MATIFRRKGSDIWTASFRAWHAAAGKWEWRQATTGQTDRLKAGGVAAKYEQAAGAAQAGTLTREKVVKILNEILSLACVDELSPTPSLHQMHMELAGLLRDNQAATAKKYRSAWAHVEKWAGKRALAPIDSFTVADMEKLYQALQANLGATTADGHLNYASMLFGRAIAHGFIASNPTKAVRRGEGDEVEKLTFSRKECAQILRQCRKEGRADWTALVGLGWHTGHRIQDMLDVTAQKMTGDLLTFRPAKKGARGGRTVTLPLPLWLARRIVRLGNFQTIRGGTNYNGRVSSDFISIMERAGIDPQGVNRGARTISLKSFHSFRHSLSSRLTSSGVSDELARLVTDHDSKEVARGYRHAEIEAVREALKKARARR